MMNQNLSSTNVPALITGGILPPGRHNVTLEEIQQAFAHHGLHPYRTVLYEQLSRYTSWVRSLRFFPALYIDGSFVTDKAAPNDVDVCLELPHPLTNPSVVTDEIVQALDKFYTKRTYSLTLRRVLQKPI
jgi:hypothetical protein